MVAAVHQFQALSAVSGARAAGCFADVAVFQDFAAAEPLWRAFEDAGGLITPYQRYDFLYPWWRHIGQALGVRPFIVVARDAEGLPILLCPFGQVQNGPLRILHFLGGKHANFNVAMWRRDRVANVTADDLHALIEQIALTHDDVDLIALTNQPYAWNGFDNPFALFRHQPSPSFGYHGALAADFETLLNERTSGSSRKKLRKKERALSACGSISYRKAATAAEALQFLDAFFLQKTDRMRRRSVANVFAEPGVREFVSELATARPNGREPLLEIYALTAGDTVASTFAGLANDKRYGGMFNSMTSCGMAQHSPGELLLHHVVRTCCERGFNVFDLGVGEASYKEAFCPTPDPLFDSFVPLSALGQLAAAGISTAYLTKRVVKNTPLLWRALGMLRQARSWVAPQV